MPRFSLLLTGLTLALLSACSLDNLDQSEIPAYTKEWVRETDGQLLRFQNAAGQVHQVAVTRQEGVGRSGGRFGSADIAYLNVKYQDQTNSALDFYLNTSIVELHFSHHENDSMRAMIYTDKKPGKIVVYSTNTQGLQASPRLLASDTTIGGQKYKYIAHLRLRPYRQSADPLTDIYVSRYEGVVAMQTVRGGLWLRQ